MTLAATLITALAALALVFVGFVLLRQQRTHGPDPRSLDLAAERDRLAALLAQAHENARSDGEELGGLRAMADAHQRLQTDSAVLRETLESTRATLHDERVARAAAGAELDDRNLQLDAARQRLREVQGELERLRGEHAQATAHLEHANRQQADMRAFVDQAQAKLADAFTAMAGKVFDERGQLFEKNVKHANTQSKADIETLLKPFAAQLGEFRTRVDTLYGEEAKERSALLGAVTELKTLNQDMAGHTAALTRALKGSSKVRGDWGELMLENVLRSSGLEEGKHYDRQKAAHDDEGARLHPDIVVRLPDDRSVVVDSKVNLIAWQEAMNAETPELQHEAMRRHAAGLRQHVKELGEKNYPKAIGESALEITIAFVPIEGALSAALGFDPALQTDAFDRKIVFASPNTLMALLRVVERLWTRDKIQRQAAEIGRQGGLVLDALMNFLAEFDNVGKRLNDANTAFNSARGRLSESNQAVIPRARRLAEHGAIGKKPLTDELKVDSTVDLLVLSKPAT